MPSPRPNPASAGYAKNPSISITSIIFILNVGNAGRGRAARVASTRTRSVAIPSRSRAGPDSSLQSSLRVILTRGDPSHTRMIRERGRSRRVPHARRHGPDSSRNDKKTGPRDTHRTVCCRDLSVCSARRKSEESQAWACSAACAASISAIRASISTLRSIGRIGGTTRVLCMQSSASTNAESGIRAIRGVEIGRVAAS